MAEKPKLKSQKTTEFVKGKLLKDTQKQYLIVIKFISQKLNCTLTFPEFNNQVLSFNLDKSSLTFGGNGDSISIENGTTITTGNSSHTNGSNHKRNPEVIGKWRFTEVLSSGSGEFYASFSTDYFIRINADGTAITWTGKSAGGTNTVSIEGSYGTNLQQYQWYTNGKAFHFIDPQTNQEQVVNYYVEPSRMMFSYGNNKRVYQRIN